MKTHTKNNISIERATDLLKGGQPLNDVYIGGELKIEMSKSWGNEVLIENCIIEYFSGSVTHFDKPVKLINCHFKKCQFIFTHFLGGLTIEKCLFDNYLDFQAGGHNKTGNTIIISNNVFNGFVNFFDCWYEYEIKISNNNFRKGSNLLGKPYNIPVTFDIKPIIKNNIGQLELNNEGEESSN